MRRLTDIECPFCGHEIYWDGVYACDNCGADEREPHVWPDAADIERDRAVYDEWLARRDEWAQGKVKESAR